MKIGNRVYNTNLTEVLDRLQLDASKQGKTYFSKGFRNSGQYIMVQCVYHKGGQENTPSAQFREDDGLYYCHACKEAKTLPKVITHVLGTNGINWLKSNFGYSTVEKRDTKFDLTREKKKATKIDPSVLTPYRVYHPYVLERGISKEVIRKFDVCYKDGYILFPSRNILGNIEYIVTRDINTKFYHFPKGIDKVVYGAYECIRENATEVYITEGIFDALTVWTYGKYAIALNGLGSKSQLELLTKLPFKTFILALDNDKKGQEATEKILTYLKGKKVTKRVYLPENKKDINDLTLDEFNNLALKSVF